jgi:hypothetical protein
MGLVNLLQTVRAAGATNEANGQAAAFGRGPAGPSREVADGPASPTEAEPSNPAGPCPPDGSAGRPSSIPADEGPDLTNEANGPADEAPAATNEANGPAATTGRGSSDPGDRGSVSPNELEPTDSTARQTFDPAGEPLSGSASPNGSGASSRAGGECATDESSEIPSTEAGGGEAVYGTNEANEPARTARRRAASIPTSFPCVLTLLFVFCAGFAAAVAASANLIAHPHSAPRRVDAESDPRSREQVASSRPARNVRGLATDERHTTSPDPGVSARKGV